MLPKRKTARLGFGRFSNPGANYFVTFVTKDRRPVLAEPENGGLIADSLVAMHRAGDAVVWAATIMPDHAHLLFTLGPRLNLGQISGHLKSAARRGRQIDWEWQKDGFERQVRSTESLEDYAFYIFMNPYCAGCARCLKSGRGGFALNQTSSGSCTPCRGSATCRKRGLD